MKTRHARFEREHSFYLPWFGTDTEFVVYGTTRRDAALKLIGTLFLGILKIEVELR